jgi:broad specificity phosphatase PhoE
LDETGRRQAEAAALRLKGEQVAAIYSSPLKRALQTAEPIAKQLKLAVQPLEGLIDIDFGSFQGLSSEEAGKKDSKLFAMWVS